MLRRVLVCLVALGFVSTAARLANAADIVDVELVLLVDASNSIDDAELRFQRQGYADALLHPQVLNAIASGLHGRIAVTLMEWADAASQHQVVGWTIVDGPDSAARFARELMAAPRSARGSNAIGNAIAAGQRLIETNDIQGLKRVIDFSGDSANNWAGIPIEPERDKAVAAGTVINGLAILCLEADCSGRPVYYDLERAFRDQITGGPGSFVITVDDRASFASAVRRKLVLEIAGREPVRAGATKFFARHHNFVTSVR